MNRICVFCGSSVGSDEAYAAAARELAEELNQRGVGLVYGGGNVGLMGILADAVLAGDGEVIGVIPESLRRREVAHNQLSELHVVDSMHQRKALMADLADGFIALPGGLGTLEELFEVWTWAQLQLHGKPLGVINAGRYYDTLLPFLDHLVQQRFVAPAHRAMLLVEQTPARLLDRFEQDRPPSTPKPFDRDVR